jgi:hypothetical protein
MTALLGRRADVRVDYREPVRVLWPGEVSGIRAQAVNLSRAGILVDAPTPAPCEVGSDVLCDVALPHGSVLLRGRVAHRRLLSPAKVGMGIEFIDLSPGEAAELRGLVDAGDERPQRVMVRFEGTNQTVRARAVATDAGFRLATALPFLKVGTALDLSLVPESSPRATGRVASVALDLSQVDGLPRLLIDVSVDGVGGASWDGKTPIVEPMAMPEAVPEEISERVWEPEELAAAVETSGPVDASVPDEDRTQIVELPPPRRRKRALAVGMLAGALGVVALGPTLLRHVAPPRAVEVPVVSQPVVASPVAAPPVAVVPAPPPTPVSHVAVEPHFKVGLTGSLAGARRYPLSAPAGVAFNLPRARPTLEMGTYETALRGVRAVWVRPLPGGGTHVRVLFTGARPAPRVTLGPGAIVVTASRP